ncbi:MAG: coenzyme F420-0:L-glutamate ligase [bacterium]|nr:coenzyme F420-0:L-glutamate ligase [bacterium]
MRVSPVKTRKIIPGRDRDIFEILDRYLPRLKECTVVAVTSKIVAICEGRTVLNTGQDKLDLAKKEANLYHVLPSRKYRMLLTIKNHRLGFTSGIDESNGNGIFILWPQDSQKSANQIRAHLAKRYGLQHVGIIITDTTSSPMLRGQRGQFLAHSGFAALNSYIGRPDIFGRKLKMTKAAVADALGTAAVLLMGEGDEQTPLAVIEDVPFVKFQKRNPTKAELKELNMELKDDLYAPVLKAIQWRKGGSKN